jgi:hypothetical protein
MLPRKRQGAIFMSMSALIRRRLSGNHRKESIAIARKQE